MKLQYRAYVECKQLASARNLLPKIFLHEILTVISYVISTTVTGNGSSINICAELGLKQTVKFNILFAAVKVLNHLQERYKHIPP